MASTPDRHPPGQETERPSRSIVPQPNTSLSPISRLAARTLDERGQRSELLERGGRILTVGEGGLETLGDAVAVARDGDTILLRPGTYVENLVVEKSLTIRGDGPRDKVILAPGATEHFCLRFVGGSGALEGVTLVRPSGRTDKPLGEADDVDDDGLRPLVRVSGGRWAVRNLLAKQVDDVIAASRCELNVSDCEFVDGWGAPISFGAGAAGRVERCKIDSMESGIYIDGAGPVTVNGCSIDGAEDAVRIFDSETVVIEGCRLSGGTGINAYDTRDLMVSHNQMLDVEEGIHLWRGAGVFQGNTIEFGVYGWNGIDASEGTASILSNTIVRPLGFGIRASSMDGTVEGNQIIATLPGDGISVSNSPHLKVGQNHTRWPSPVAALDLAACICGVGIRAKEEVDPAAPPEGVRSIPSELTNLVEWLDVERRRQVATGRVLPEQPNVVDWALHFPQRNGFAGETDDNGTVELLLEEISCWDDDERQYLPRPIAWAVGKHLPRTRVTLWLEAETPDSLIGALHDGSRWVGQVDFYPVRDFMPAPALGG